MIARLLYYLLMQAQTETEEVLWDISEVSSWITTLGWAILAIAVIVVVILKKRRNR